MLRLSLVFLAVLIVAIQADLSCENKKCRYGKKCMEIKKCRKNGTNCKVKKLKCYKDPCTEKGIQKLGCDKATEACAEAPGDCPPHKKFCQPVGVCKKLELSESKFPCIEIKDREHLDTYHKYGIVPAPLTRFPRDTLVIGYEIFARRNGSITLQVLEPTGYGLNFWQTDWTEFNVPSAGKHRLMLSESEQFNAISGNTLGFYHKGPSIIPYDGHHCPSYHYKTQVTGEYEGYRKKYDRLTSGWMCRTYSIRAITKVASGICNIE